MPGLPKRGLDYYVVSVRRCREVKTLSLITRYGCKGFVALDTLREAVFESGPYLEFDSINELIDLICAVVRIDQDEATKIIYGLIEMKYFDEESFYKGFLTSSDIQKRYYFATKERKDRDIDQCCLLTQEEMNAIDSGARLNRLISGEYRMFPGKDRIIPTKDDMFPGKDGPSKRKTKIERESKIEKIEKLEKRVIANEEFPFKPNYYFLSLITEGIITGYEVFAEVLNDAIAEAVSSSNKDEFKFAFRVLVNELKLRDFKDSEGRIVEDKLNYIKTALERNIYKAAYDLGHKEVWPELKDDELF